MKYLFTLLIFLPLTSTAQNIGIYIDTAGQVAIGNDTVWEPFQVFAETGPQLQLDQQSAEMGNTAGLLITAGVENGQSFTCGLTGQLVSVSLRLGTVPDAGNTMLEVHIREGSAPTGSILATSSFAISDDEMQWYDIAVTPFIDVMAGDEFFIEVVHTGGDQAEWDWVEGTNPYSGGTSWQNQTSWLEITSSDFVFRTYVIADGTTDVLSVTSSGKVKINDYLLPQFDGVNNQVMVTNGTGVLSWQDMSGSGSDSLLQDADGDTKIQVEESADEDIIRFDMGGTEYFRMESGRLKILNTGNSVIIGDEAGIFEDLGGNDNVFIGTSAGWANNGISNTVIGNGALSSNWTGGSNTAIGRSALGFGNTGSGNTAVGWQALVSNAGTHNTGIGAASLQLNSSGNYNTVVGHSALVSNLSGHWNTAIGWAAGNNNSSGSANVFLGYLAGANETGSNKLYIANSGAGPTGALIYGDFLDQLLRINGTLNINNAYSFPTTDGSLGQVLQTDGSGLLSWQTVSGGGGGSSIEDTDGDTKIQTEEIANEDKIRFDLGGTEHFVMDGPRLEVKNSGRSVFLGQGAGANDDLSNRNNTFLGYQSGMSSVGGENNSAIGAYAFESSISGSYNTVHGVHAMRNSSGGESNSAFGYNALNSNTSSSNVAMGASALSSNLDGHANVGIGSSSLTNNTSGDHNTAIGTQALFSNKAGSRGTAIGYHAMLYGNNTTSSFENHNVAVGYEALRGSGVASANTGNANTAIGYQSLVNNSSGFQNTATGSYALTSNTWGTDNTASGSYALWANTIGTYNTASGYRALYLNIDGTHNTASGVESLQGNTTGDYNAAYGTSSLYSNISGNNNTALGVLALASNKAGSAGTAIGYGAMHYSNNTTTPFVNTNVAVGFEALRGSTTPGSNTGLYNTAVGYRALMPNTSGSQNTAFGYSTLTSNTTGDYNLAMGVDALGSNISGNENTAAGNFALRRNTGGHWNTGLGFSALEENTTGTYNTALGHEALNANVGGTRATAIGTHAMRYANNTLSEFNNGNIAVGFEALRGSTIPANNTGNWNTVIGFESMRINTTGEGNTVTGYTAMRSNVTGVYNTAIGFEALRNNTQHRNTAVGAIALKANTSGQNNTAVGTFALENNATGGNNTALGYSANSLVGNFTNSMGLGYEADPTATNRVHIGNNSVSWIGGQVGWATYSDGRFKSDITEEVVGLDFINQLRPVTYNIDLDEIQDWKALHYNERDSSDYPEKYEIEAYRFSGFIAQEVENASRNTGYDFSGVCPPKNEKDFYSLRYAEFVVPLVKAVQELSEENEALKAQNQQFSDLLLSLQQKVAMLEME